MAIKKQIVKEETKVQLYKLPYKFNCPMCGEVIENKFFRLDELLDQYYYGAEIDTAREGMIGLLGIGACYGKLVLPAVPSLLGKDADGNTVIQKPDFPELRGRATRLKTFATTGDTSNVLRRIDLNIASIVAQFWLNTGFDAFYEMLQLKQDLRADRNNKEKKARLEQLCDELVLLPRVQVDDISDVEGRREQVNNVINDILLFAQAEASQPERTHFAAEPLWLGWRYETINSKEMPVSLVTVGATSKKRFDCTQGCCDKCYSQVPKEYGAYKQMVVGVLGTQSTGKTTYLMALTDAIDKNEATTVTLSNDEKQSSRLLINHAFANDYWWNRVGKNQEASNDVGLLWMYQNGYPPEKTRVQENEAPALTFLISRKGRESEMLTLADIPGEAFYNTVSKKYSQQQIDAMTKLLDASKALITVISSKQMNLEEVDLTDTEKKEMVTDPNEVMACYKEKMPKKAVPTAIVMTSADRIHNGDLRTPLNMAYDIRSLRPLVWSESAQALVYNAEAMGSAERTVRNFVNANFGDFAKNAANEQEQKTAGEKAILAAFAVSNGTQHYPFSYEDSRKSDKCADPEYNTETKRGDRYKLVRQSRFGVTGPLLWLLACAGWLETGCGENEYNKDYPAATKKAIYKKLANYLYN